MRFSLFTGLALVGLIARKLKCTSVTSSQIELYAAQTNVDEIIGAPKQKDNKQRELEKVGKGEDSLPKAAIRELLRREKLRNKKHKKVKQCKKCAVKNIIKNAKRRYKKSKMKR